jgi:hypothetical protein
LKAVPVFGGAEVCANAGTQRGKAIMRLATERAIRFMDIRRIGLC